MKSIQGEEFRDEYWMKKALQLASKAALRGEVPVAAIVVGPEGLISHAINTRERQQTPLGHAEIMALHKASKKRNSWRLSDCTLYVTLEPCVMCSGAIQQARLARVVYGAADEKAGAVKSLYRVLNDPRLNHQVEVSSGICAEESTDLLQNFFRNRRDEKKAEKAERIYRERSSVIVLHKNKILGFHAVDPTSKVPYFFLPGGGIEPGESAAATSERECMEETGYKIKILEDTAFEKKYDFPWNGELFSTKTVFFLGVLDEAYREPGTVTDGDYHKGVAWLDIKKVPEIFGYTTEVLWAVQKLIKTAKKRKLT
jgi:tRNA(adenine34) deaminase